MDGDAPGNARTAVATFSAVTTCAAINAGFSPIKAVATISAVAAGNGDSGNVDDEIPYNAVAAVYSVNSITAFLRR